MNTPNPVPVAEIDAPRGDLRPGEHSPRPIHHSETGANGRRGDRR
jgi:hypothetical protein